MNKAEQDATPADGGQTAQVIEYMAELHRWAMTYHEAGLCVIPLRLSDKRALLPWLEYQERCSTAAEIDDWFANGVDDERTGQCTRVFGLGVITGAVSGIVVLDCDNEDARDYAIVERDWFSFAAVRTTRGLHYWFRHPGEHVHNKVGGTSHNWPEVGGLDLRGDGGLVVVPPTIKFAGDGTTHEYRWLTGTADLPDLIASLPVWHGPEEAEDAASVASAEGGFDFAALSLKNIRVTPVSAWDSARRFVADAGRKMRDGDGRNNLITRLVGEAIRADMDDESVRSYVGEFQREWFESDLPEAEVTATLLSVRSSDKRRNPGKYRAVTPAAAKPKARPIKLITPETVSDLRGMASGALFHVDPYLPAEGIVQVVGFNGHGKSLFLLNLCWAASLGITFGPGHVERKVKCLYLDFELASGVISARIDDLVRSFGEMGPEMAIWADSTDDEGMSLTTEEGLARLAGYVNTVKPHVVVIDTVRSAFPGMEERSPNDWHRVNQVAKQLRKAGHTVVLVHHRNKPTQHGMGREAGSTAQLTDLDTQIIVTKVVEDKQQAEREAALQDAETRIRDFSGKEWTAHGYMRAKLADGYMLSYVTQIAFGKVRQTTENHATAFIGLASHTQTGAIKIVSTLLPRQKVHALAGRLGPEEIAERLGLPLPTVTRWAERRGAGS